MADIVVSGNSSGSVTLRAPDVSGTTILTLPTTTGTLVVTGGAQTIEFADGTVSAPSITNSGDTNTGIYFPAADIIGFTEGGTEVMRINSDGNVLIGGTQSLAKLTVNNGIFAVDESGVGTKQVYIRSNYGAIGPAIQVSTNDPLLFVTNNNERMRIDSSGNVGIDITPAYRFQVRRAGGAGSLGVSVDTIVGAVRDVQYYAVADSTSGASAHTFYVRNGSATDNLALRISQDGTLTLRGGNTSATGVGITFPATQSASSDANTLDDYEEGTWTPTIQGGTTGGTTTYGSQVGWYVKVGNTVTVGFYITWSAATGTGSLLIGGLPFSAGSGSKYAAGGLMTQGLDWTGGTMATLYKPPGNSNLEIYGSGDAINWVQQTMDGAAELIGGCTYSV
jgi:hypothetical protein